MKIKLFFIITILFMMIISLMSLFLGQFSLDFQKIQELIQHLFNLDFNSLNSTEWFILYQLRLPRVISAFLVGSLLAISGACLQGLFRNPLVEPSLIGVSAGAASFVVIFLVVFHSIFKDMNYLNQQNLLIPIIAFLGALITVKIVISLASIQGRTSIASLLLSGIAINAFSGALMGMVLYFADDQQLRTITFWSLGSFSNISWFQTYCILPFFIICSFLFYKYYPQLNILTLGEEQAITLGINVQVLTKKVIYISCLSVGACVAFTGMIGFIGLIIPHVTRFILGPNFKHLIPASAILGGSLLILSDTIARSSLSGAELPIGSITALIGGPFFLYQILKSKKELSL